MAEIEWRGQFALYNPIWLRAYLRAADFMTIAELIVELQAYTPESQVLIYADQIGITFQVVGVGYDDDHNVHILASNG